MFLAYPSILKMIFSKPINVVELENGKIPNLLKSNVKKTVSCEEKIESLNFEIIKIIL